MNKTKTKKVNFPAVLMKLTIIILGLLLFYTVGGLIQLKDVIDVDNNMYPEKNNVQENYFSKYFPGCDLLEGNCVSSDCDKYFLCNDKKYSVCEIYDCRGDFGVGTIDADGKTAISKKNKAVRDEIKKIIEKCQGSFEVLSSDCVNNKLKMRVQVSTEGDCEVLGFLAIYGNDGNQDEQQVKSAIFLDLKNNTYAVSFDTCKDIISLIATGESGVGIKQKK
ncbi:MAG: hypothetical protein P1P85_03485 [Patescibacteria group bacterium]|nr:hypothetical protein [Patescibacteria group bacterium]